MSCVFGGLYYDMRYLGMMGVPTRGILPLLIYSGGVGYKESILVSYIQILYLDYNIYSIRSGSSRCLAVYAE